MNQAKVVRKKPFTLPPEPPVYHDGPLTLKVWTIPEVQHATNACYDVGKHLPHGWSGTIEQIVDLPDYPLKDLIWICTHPMICPHQILHPFKAWTISRAIEIFNDPAFKKPAHIPIDLAAQVKASAVHYDVIEDIWDTQDRKEQVDKFKTLLTVAKGTK